MLDRTSNGHSATILRSYVDRIVHLEEEKKQAATDIRAVKAEAKSRGFDPKALSRIVREAMETKEQRRAREETEEITDLYRGALGMLDGTPLGDAARRRAIAKKVDPTEDSESAEVGAPAPEALSPKPAAIGPAEIEAARNEGRQSAAESVPVLKNPYTAGDPRRAAWDEGWCERMGSDGMEIPPAWRRAPKPKKPKKPAGGSDAGQGDDGGDA